MNWIINFLPDFVTHFLVLAGILGLLFSAIAGPLFLYKLPLQIIAVLVLSFGLYSEGVIANQAVWKAKVAALEVKLEAAVKESKKVNTQIVVEYRDKVKVVKQRGKTITEYVDREVVKYDKTCPIPSVVVKVHNAAAKNDTTLLGSPEPTESKPAVAPAPTVKPVTPATILAPKKK